MKKLMILIVVLFTILLSVNAFAGKCACEFTSFSDETGGLYKAEKDFIFIFITKKGSEVAALVTKKGTVPVLVLPNTQGGITFLESTPVGGITITTMDVHGNAVHSRNTIIGGKLIPSQYYGTCLYVPDEK